MARPAWPPLRCRGRDFHWGSRTYVMGILNVTPDSFFDGGVYTEPEAAARHAVRMVEEGADLIDIGAESTRPGSEPVPAAEELDRLLPALRAVRAAVDVPVSVDTRKAEVAAAALAAGADMINDVSGLQDDPDLAGVVARHGAALVVMHRRPHGFTDYADLWADVQTALEQAIARAVQAGVPRERILVDPGFGFGKSPEQNLELIRGLGRLRELGPVLVGPSRKSTIGHILGLPPSERLAGTLALSTLAVAAGADVVRVHDVQAHVRALRVADAVVRGGPAPGPEPEPVSIALTGMAFWARHGVLDHERATGQPFRVDLRVECRRTEGADELAATVDYAMLYRLARDVVEGEPCRLIETVAERLAARVLAADARILAVDVTVHKPHAPVGGPLTDAAVRVRRRRGPGGVWVAGAPADRDAAGGQPGGDARA